MNVKLPDVVPARRATQWIFMAIVLLIGVQFSLWVIPHMRGIWPDLSRPAGVEAFLPIDAMMAFRHLLLTGEVDAVHPAGLAIFIGICLMSVVFAKSFCSHVCPVGLISELLGRLGIRLVGRTLTPPKWLDLPLRSLKFLLLGFFVWAVWFAMDGEALAAFLSGPYARIVDAKMWLFFAPPSRLTVAVLGVLVIGSVFVRDLWCRYLCPYGALVGLLGRFALFKVTRDPELCTGCEGCTRVCPARLPVHQMQRVGSVECTGCQDCVVACPEDGCLTVRPAAVTPARSWTRPVVPVVFAVSLYLMVVAGFRFAGFWHTTVTEAEYHQRLQEIRSPLYSHPR